MKKYDYLILDVFTDQQFGGNQLAFFPNAEGMESEEMQKIAREFNFSETTFVLPALDESHTCSLRIFTPNRELPFAGHPIVGSAIGLMYLTPETDKITFGLRLGNIPIDLQGGGKKGVSFTNSTKPEFKEFPLGKELLAGAFGVSPEDLESDVYPVMRVSLGIDFVMLPIRNVSVLEKSTVLPSVIEAIEDAYGCSSFYLFTEDGSDESDYRCRMFAPTEGIFEDPATGSAANAFGHYLWKILDGKIQPEGYVIRQGVEMKRPSTIEMLHVTDGETLNAIQIGGSAVVVSQGTFLLG